MQLPKIGDIIDNDLAIELCLYFGYGEIAQRISTNPELFKPWQFDGASCTPDNLASEILNIPNLTEIALKHDIKHAYGELGDEVARIKSNFEMGIDFLNDGASVAATLAGVTLVNLLSGLPSPFGWGFARI